MLAYIKRMWKKTEKRMWKDFASPLKYHRTGEWGGEGRSGELLVLPCLCEEFVLSVNLRVYLDIGDIFSNRQLPRIKRIIYGHCLDAIPNSQKKG